MLDYRGSFEVHITVRPASQSTLDQFRDWCRAHDCKCVHIVLARGEHVEQPMTTWRRYGATLPLVVAETRRLAAELERADIPVVRMKIEADPDNDDVPQQDADTVQHDPGNYFEYHVKLRRDVNAARDALMQTCVEHGAHLSRNAWREPAQGQEERFVTLRCYRLGRRSSEGRLQQMIASLNELGEQIVEIESEYSVHDSNLSLDAGWLP